MAGAVVVGAGPGIGRAGGERRRRARHRGAAAARHGRARQRQPAAHRRDAGAETGLHQPVAGQGGLRTAAALLDAQYRSSGVHVATVTVAGPVAPGTAWDPDDIAEHYWRLHHQPREAWTHEVVH